MVPQCRDGEVALPNTSLTSPAAELRFVTGTTVPSSPSFKVKAIHVVASILNEASGLSYSVPRLCQELGEAGHSITLMTIGDGHRANQSSYRIEPCRPAFMNVPIVQRLQPSRTMRRKLHEEARKISILHVHGLWLMPNIYPSMVARRYGVPLILAPRGMLGPEALRFSRYRKYLMWYAAQRSAVEAASCLHATSEQEYAEIRNFGLRQPVAVVPNGVDVPLVPSGVRDRGSGGRTIFISAESIQRRVWMD